MDTITHGIVGALVGKAFFSGQNVPLGSAEGSQQQTISSSIARVGIAACTVGSIFPDIDVFAGPIAHNPLAILEWHRNITHSIVMLTIWAVLLAAVSLPLARWLGWKPPTFGKLAGIYAVGIATHIFLDAATNFGTMVWSPLNHSRVSWDWLFIVDLMFTAIALTPQLVAWCYRTPRDFSWRAIAVWIALSAGGFGAYALAGAAGYGFAMWVVGAISAVMAGIVFLPAIGGIGFRWRRASWCRAGVAALCAYIGFAVIAHRTALAHVEEFVAARHLQVESMAALPLPPTFTHWSGVVNTPEGVWRTTFHVPGGNVEREQLYASDESDRDVFEAKQLRSVQKYLWFARFPIWHVIKDEGQTVVEVTDVRFFRGEGREMSDTNLPAKRFAGLRVSGAGFTLQVAFDAQGRVIYDGIKPPQR